MSIFPKPPHRPRGSTTTGAGGERHLVGGSVCLLQKPSGEALRFFLEVLREDGYEIPPTSFDLVWVPEEAVSVSGGFCFENRAQVTRWRHAFKLVEIKTCTQDRSGDGFSQMMFSIPESELQAAEQMGEARYRVLFYNRNSKQVREASMPEVLALCERGTAVWQLSVQFPKGLDGWDSDSGLLGEEITLPDAGPDIFDLFPEGAVVQRSASVSVKPERSPDIFTFFKGA